MFTFVIKVLHLPNLLNNFYMSKVKYLIYIYTINDNIIKISFILFVFSQFHQYYILLFI